MCRHRAFSFNSILAAARDRERHYPRNRSNTPPVRLYFTVRHVTRYVITIHTIGERYALNGLEIRCPRNRGKCPIMRKYNLLKCMVCGVYIVLFQLARRNSRQKTNNNNNNTISRLIDCVKSAFIDGKFCIFILVIFVNDIKRSNCLFY